MHSEGSNEAKSGNSLEGNVDDGQIMMATAHCGQRLFGIAGLAAKPHIGLKVQNLRQTLAHDRVVIYDQDSGLRLAVFIFVWQCAHPYVSWDL